MLFGDVIVLIDETRKWVSSRLEAWREALESRGFKISRSKTIYMDCRFNNTRKQDNRTLN